MNSHKTILFLVPYPLKKAPSQRFRVELFFSLLREQSIKYDVQCFFSEKTWAVLYNRGHILAKLSGVVLGFLKRSKLVLFSLHRYDYVFIHRETSPFGPPFFEWVIAKLWRKKIIYDFDDAIWVSDSNMKIINWFKAFWKIGVICRWSYKVSAGNSYLAQYASQFNHKVIIIPTCVDTLKSHNQLKDQYNEKVVIGWTGSHSTLFYLDLIEPILKKLAASDNILILIICNKPPSFSFPNLHFIQWDESSEIEDLLKINIGIMPLIANKWSEGKCGFKLIQYLSLGIPAVASPVGVNNIIIKQGINGFLCAEQDEWYTSLLSLVKDEDLRKKMGSNGRQGIIKSYSVLANSGTFLKLFE
ncbi:MAG: glycosyltransferase family 4 protein [Flavisolibacter sp.]